MPTAEVPSVDAAALVAACEAGLGEPPPAAPASVEGAGALVRWLVERVRRARYAPLRLREAYCTRSALDVLRDGDLPFTAPCADLSSVAAALLARAGVPVTLVLAGIARPLRGAKFQCGLELDLDGRAWVLGFGVAGTSLYAGRFEPTAHRPWIYRRRPPALELDRPFLAAFDGDGREGVTRLVPGYDLGRDLASHARRSGPVAFALAEGRARARHARPRPSNLVARLPFGGRS